MTLRGNEPVADFAELSGKRFALIMVAEEEDGAVFICTARWDGQHLYWQRSDATHSIEIPEHRLKEVRRTDVEDREIVGDAEYLIMMTVASLPDDEFTDEYLRTGLEWPSV